MKNAQTLGHTVVLFLLTASLAMAANADVLPTLQDFTPLKQRQLFNQNDIMIVQFADDFCPRCEKQLAVVNSILQDVDTTYNTDKMAGLYINMDLWDGDPFVEPLDIKWEPTLIVFIDRKPVARIEKVPFAQSAALTLQPLIDRLGTPAPAPQPPAISETQTAPEDSHSVQTENHLESSLQDDTETVSWEDIPEEVPPLVEPIEDPQAMPQDDPYDSIRSQLKPGESLVIRDGIPTIVINE